MNIQILAPPAWPGARYPKSAYSIGKPKHVMMPASTTEEIKGFSISAALGIVYGHMDSDIMSADQPETAHMIASMRKGALASLMAEAAAIGANGLTNIKMEFRRYSYIGPTIHIDASASAVKVKPMVKSAFVLLAHSP